VQVLDDLQKHAGDKVTYGLSKLLVGAGVVDLNNLTGNEEPLNTFADSLFVHELAHGVLLAGPISDQRVLFDRRKLAQRRLADWYAARFDHAIINQLAGYTPQSNTAFTGLNAVTVATRQIIAGGKTDPASLASSDTFDLKLVDQAVSKSKSLANGIRPIQVSGRQVYCLAMHPSQAQDLRTNTNVAQWIDIQKAAMTGGDIGDNPIFWNSLGMYHGVLLHESSRITNSVSNAGAAVANTKRALYIGAQAAAMAWGRHVGAQGEGRYMWLEELRDYGRQLGVAVSSIHGIKKSTFNAMDYAVIVIDTYGADIDTVGSAEYNAL
jgi:N4-gp56 family major capsid protein